MDNYSTDRRAGQKKEVPGRLIELLMTRCCCSGECCPAGCSALGVGFTPS